MDFHNDYKVDANPSSWTRSMTESSSPTPTCNKIESKNQCNTILDLNPCLEAMPFNGSSTTWSERVLIRTRFCEMVSLGEGLLDLKAPL